MAGNNTFSGGLEGKGLRIAIVAARFNFEIVDALVEGALEALAVSNVEADSIDIVLVPGCFELPLAAQHLARKNGKKKYDAIIALGAVIRGDTPHFDYVAGETARGLMQVSLTEDLPVAFGVLTCDNLQQAMQRADADIRNNKGADAAKTVLEMVNVFSELK